MTDQPMPNGGDSVTVSRSRLCAFCGGSFLLRSTHPKQRYCSLSHAMQDQKRLPWIVCGWADCGIRFPQRKARQRFCSISCGQYARRRAA
jgi:hypothetical protein